MAGSYHHVVDEETGRLRDGAGINSMLECMSGDVVECVEEMYGMIWWLAEKYARSLEEAQGEPEGTHSAAGMVEEACQHYKEGLALSPGTGAELPEDDEL